jgi:hypothetical protein
MTAWHGGKGSSSRPKQVSNEDYANRWDAIFGRDKNKTKDEPLGKALEEEPLEEDEND